MEEVTKTPENGEKTFTQEEVNGIVAERLARDRKNYADYESLKEKAAKFDELEEKNKSDLQKETERAEALQKELDAMKKAESIRSVRETVAKENNVPADLLTGETEEECKAQAEKLIAFSGLSRSMFLKKFKEEFGTTPKAWMTEKFKKELEFYASRPNMKTSHLASLLRMSDVRLCQISRRLYGCSPQQLIERKKP